MLPAPSRTGRVFVRTLKILAGLLVLALTAALGVAYLVALLLEPEP